MLLVFSFFSRAARFFFELIFRSGAEQSGDCRPVFGRIFSREARNCFRGVLSRKARNIFEEGISAKRESLLSEGAFSRSAPAEDAAWYAEVTMAPNMKRAGEQAHG